MTPNEFVRTIYLGDRACKALIIDSWNAVVRIQVDCISRIRSSSGNWDYYTDEDITDGYLVFTNIQSCELQNNGHLPNDSINSLDIVGESDGQVTVELSIDSVDANADHHETFLRLSCGGMHLEDPARPSIRIDK